MSKKPVIEVFGNNFCITIDSDTNMEALQNVMNEIQDAWVCEEIRVAKEFNVSAQTAQGICYLRTRSRHTQELEQRLIDADRAGMPVDMGSILSGEWPE